MTHLIQIGNSQGLRIPKPLIEQAALEGKELFLEVVENGLLIRPEIVPRSGWREQIRTGLQTKEAGAIDADWLDADLVTDQGLWE